MSSWVERVAAAALVLLAAGAAHAQADRFPGIGRAATAAEVKAWDIDVRPDFAGLPKGSGSVARGQDVWEGKCASCHGVFGESNEVFAPLVGGTTDEDIRTGRVANLRRSDFPGRSTLMKLSTLSTLWDYINRAMPWNAPKSLSTDEVYAVTAYLLNLGRIVADDFVLSDRNIADVQQRLPNRNGVSTSHGLWPGKEFDPKARPDVQATACMKDCPVEEKVASILPPFARNAHGNLAEQNRLVGPQRGADTTRPEGAPALAKAAPPQRAPVAAAAATQAAPSDLLARNTCTACHASDRKLVGPSWADIAAKHAGRGDYLAGKIRSGGAGVWGNVPMPPQALSADDARYIADWLASGAGR
ncbi:MAG: c-type cytochrome [Burkholderiales bacterium]|nr:c-type cytochrome [Burkholderiales bacterium]